MNHFLKDLSAEGLGLEIAPYFRPRLFKSECDVMYTDMISNEEIALKVKDNPDAVGSNPVPIIDFVWTPGTLLKDCAPDGIVFDYVLAAHVIEHVPNPIGWINNILSVVKLGGRICLFVPNKMNTFDYFRRETTVSDLVGYFIEQRSIPSPAQVFDFASGSIEYRGGTHLDLNGIRFEDAKRSYTDQEAVKLATETFIHGNYLDVHCTVWTPESFITAFRKVSDLGLLNVDVSDPLSADPDEFVVFLTKRGEPPIGGGQQKSASERHIERLEADLEHARNAFHECNKAFENHLRQRK